MLTKKQLAELRRSKVQGRNRIGRAMELAGLTQAELGLLVDRPQGDVSKIKNGRYGDLRGETMRKFAHAFGCQIEDLFPALDEARAS